jgi:Primosomal protein N'' (replication factor Y) - superfamily II helicase
MPDCSLRLTLHRRRRQLRCHVCGFIRPVPNSCEQCGEEALLPLGAGTEKVEEQLQAALPDLRFARMDRDSVNSEQKRTGILDAFANGSLDCLIGTQMIIKGHHFPNVTLVGVINADHGLSLPDFRAAERWWQQLTQVLGRAGRGSRPGKVIIQTRNPEAPWLACIGDEHSRAFLDRELELRRGLNFRLLRDGCGWSFPPETGTGRKLPLNLRPSYL